jgi:hypothetical protein
MQVPASTNCLCLPQLAHSHPIKIPLLALCMTRRGGLRRKSGCGCGCAIFRFLTAAYVRLWFPRYSPICSGRETDVGPYKIAAPGRARCEVASVAISPLPMLLVAIVLLQRNWGLALPSVLMLLTKSALRHWLAPPLGDDV